MLPALLFHPILPNVSVPRFYLLYCCISRIGFGIICMPFLNLDSVQKVLWLFLIGFQSIYYLSLIHISEPTRLRRISYAVFCLKKKKKKKNNTQKRNKKQYKKKKKKKKKKIK